MSSAEASPTDSTARQPQPISAELRRWIIEQTRAGIAPEALRQAMEAAGWTEAVALHAMQSTLAEHLSGAMREADGQATATPLVEAEPLPPAVAVPDPVGDGQALYLEAGDRRVPVLVTLRTPRIVVLGQLLTDAECDALIAAARPRLARSLTVAVQTGGEELNADRTSEGMFFTRGEDALIEAIEARIAALLHWPIENGEGLQVLRYPPQAEYKPHYDYFDPQQAGTPVVLKRGGQRVATLIIYLNEPEQGGATVFPDVRFEVAPKRGNAVFFSYDRPHPSSRSLHGGAPVLRGEKWIATKWLRERRFD